MGPLNEGENVITKHNSKRVLAHTINNLKSPSEDIPEGQWLGLQTFTTKGLGFNPWWGKLRSDKPHSMSPPKKKKKENTTQNPKT